MKKTITKQGGARTGAGRKPLGESESVMYSMRVTPEQRAKIDAIGGAPRLRKFIDLAKLPT